MNVAATQEISTAVEEEAADGLFGILGESGQIAPGASVDIDDALLCRSQFDVGWYIDHPLDPRMLQASTR